MKRWPLRTGNEAEYGMGLCLPLNESAMGKLVRETAVRMTSGGEMRLRVDRRTVRELYDALNEAARLSDALTNADGALLRLTQDAGLIEACLSCARTESRQQLPSDGAAPRILTLARLILTRGEQKLTKERLTAAVAAFDEVQNLRMREMLLIPVALRIALLGELQWTAGEIVRFSRGRLAAEHWVEQGGRGRVPAEGQEAFFERALQLAVEQEEPGLRRSLDHLMFAQGLRAENPVEGAHRMYARSCLRLENLISAIRLVDTLDWQKCFEQLSPTEAELCEDPSGVYPEMDAESRTAIRLAVETLADSIRVSELTVARYAAGSARDALREEGRRDPRATICYWLYTDAGRGELVARMGSVRRLRRRVPDAGGRLTAWAVCLAVLLTAALLAFGIGNPILMIYALPLAWMCALRILGRVYVHWVRPNRLLKLKLAHVPEALRTLVVLPVLLSSEARAREMLKKLETLGVLEQEENIDFLLLGDFRDTSEQVLREDAAIFDCACAGVARLNLAAGREKYFYLNRPRSLRERDARWMGENRKRGAILALNRLLLGEQGAEQAFLADNAGNLQRPERDYRYIVTLDADTELLPGTLERMIGAIAHPLNRACMLHGRRRGYAVLQPNMELMTEAVDNAYVREMAGTGGVDSYPVSVSNFYQDMTGYGSFAGKGIYDLAAFQAAVSGKLPEDEILSHDLIEGILSGCGYLDDVNLYDGCPATLEAELQRLHRWTRGDWQLLRVLFGLKGLSALDRLKLAGNLLRSLYAPALLGLMIHSVWLGAREAFAVALLLAYLEPILELFGRGPSRFRRATLELAKLPMLTSVMLDAILRTLWRVLVSHRHLMDWVPAADAQGERRRTATPGRVAALLLLPGLLEPFWIPAVVALGALFVVAPGWIHGMERQKLDAGGELAAEEVAILNEQAQKIWLFFERYVPLSGNGMPPDNVQLDPPTGAAPRTSPTNIGLYLLSCIAASELGFIRRTEMLARMSRCTDTLERLEKWRGQLYNWYDIVSEAPLHPKYVSAVDSGNLAGALLLCAHAVRDADGALSARLRALAEQMDFRALYDSERELFRIGADAERDRLSESHYDLYASESRILSFSAIMLGQAPLRHWKRLARPMVRLGRNPAPVSWSGTLFEYLMPEILMHTHPESFAGQGRRAVVDWEMRDGRLHRRPWGVSESGYYAFDLHLNYQYRAFGLRDLALGGNAVQDVTAPYASCLALCSAPSGAARNLMAMRRAGWEGEFGMYEAADYLRRDAEGAPRLVKSYMAHHQGMALCALANALRNNLLSECFMDIPEARALRLLLQEKPGRRPHIRRKSGELRRENRARPAECAYARPGRAGQRIVDTHLLSGAGTTVLLTARGAAFMWAKGVQLNRFSGDLLNEGEGMYVHLEQPDRGGAAVFGHGGCVFDAGCVRYMLALDGLRAELMLCVSPEDGTLYQRVEVINNADRPAQVCVCGCMAAALAPDADMRAHPAFQNLFVESARPEPGTLILKRRPRMQGSRFPELVYRVTDGRQAEAETDMEKLVGRSGALSRPGGIAGEFTGTVGNVLNPAAALRVPLTLAPGEKRTVCFSLAAVEAGEEEIRLRETLDAAMADRARQLAVTQAHTLLSYACIDAQLHRLLQRFAAFLFDSRLHAEINEHFEACEPAPRRKLWALGISGDLPVLTLRAAETSQLRGVRTLIHMHEFYRMMGVSCDLVLIDDCGSDYARPVHGALADLIASSHLNGADGVPGGVFLLDAQNLEPEAERALLRASVCCFQAERDIYGQLRAALDALATQGGEPAAPMPRVPDREKLRLRRFNGYGGFGDAGYEILLRNGRIPPAPWSNILAAEHFGAVVTERGGGFLWHENSRSGRLTTFANDTLREGWGWMLYLVDENSRRWLRLLPGDRPMTDFRVGFTPESCRFRGSTEGLAFDLRLHAEDDGLILALELRNTGRAEADYLLAGIVDWLMGMEGPDAVMLRTWARFGACFASGAIPGVGFFACDDLHAEPGCSRLDFLAGGDLLNPRGLNALGRRRGGWTLRMPVHLAPNERRELHLMIGCAPNVREAYRLARQFRAGLRPQPAAQVEKRLRVETPDEGLNLLANGFLPAQVLSARIRARTGLYQPGGAYGFRDQLQDMLAMIEEDPARVRRHLLYAASRQFEDGDVLHWWHEPYAGVRTRISDDLLFLPYVAAKYVAATGDAAVLSDSAPYLAAVEIPEGKEDIYADMQPSENFGTLHEHCMRAFQRASAVGAHGLCLMGGGDWNDGMNRVGAEGRGESVWLSEFLAACADEYAAVAPEEDARAWLTALSDRMRAAVENSGWDGEWYLRAYADDGTVLGSAQSRVCRIDVISQAWAVLAGLDDQRCTSAMRAAWDCLADEALGVIRLLAPPFDGQGFDPGYIAAYPPGIRENGAQYTHAACWMALALIRMGDAERAHRALRLLLPLNHSDSREAAERYRVEPYVMAADIYTDAQHAGRGGWTWYTGSAAWMLAVIYALLGYERRGNRVRLNALLGEEWDRASVVLRFGGSEYHLSCLRECTQTELDGEPVGEPFIEMRDDGRRHTALFPPRETARPAATKAVVETPTQTNKI